VFKQKNRSMDLIVALSACCLFSPVILLVGLILFARYGNPVFYREKRSGLHGKPFTLYKFKTLHREVCSVSSSQDMANRINKNDTPQTCCGRLCGLLRKYSIDELPQLWNILIGDMAVVGPRPMPFEELQHRFGHDAAKILSVRPGLTGLWQVSGRNDLSPEDRRRLELLYVQNQSAALDIRILLKTVEAVLSGRGAY